jgi:hypothetical protein
VLSYYGGVAAPVREVSDDGCVNAGTTGSDYCTEVCGFQVGASFRGRDRKLQEVEKRLIVHLYNHEGRGYTLIEKKT